MEDFESYFIDEQKIKQSIAGDRPVKNEVRTDSNVVQETDKDSCHESIDTLPSPPAKEKEDGETSHLKNMDKPPLDSFFETPAYNVRARSRISIRSDISYQLKQVALYMEQAEMPHSVNTYINNVLSQHLKEYGSEINQLKDKQL